MTRYNNYQDGLLDLLKNASPLAHNKLMCDEIRQKTKEIYLPNLTENEITEIRRHMNGYEKITTDNEKNKLQIKFLNLRNIFLLIYQYETDVKDIQMRNKIRTILIYLNQYNYIFNLIIEAQQKTDSIKLQKAMANLNLEINQFCMKYKDLLQIKDITPNFEATPTNEPILVEDIPSAEQQTPEENLETEEEQKTIHNYVEEEK